MCVRPECFTQNTVILCYWGIAVCCSLLLSQVHVFFSVSGSISGKMFFMT